jgi:hypothetical protein
MFRDCALVQSAGNKSSGAINIWLPRSQEVERKPFKEQPVRFDESNPSLSEKLFSNG